MEVESSDEKRLKLCPNCQTMLHPITENELAEQMSGGSGGGDIKKAISVLSEERKIELNEVTGIDLEKVVNTSEYKDLPSDKQEIVYNHIQDLLPVQKKRLAKLLENTKSSSKRTYRVYLTCPKGDFTQPIPPKMVIKDRYLKRSSQVVKNNKSSMSKNMVQNRTLPTTRYHECSNGANCVAVKRESQSDINNATNAAVPMPPAKFSRTITIPIPKSSVS